MSKKIMLFLFAVSLISFSCSSKEESVQKKSFPIIKVKTEFPKIENMQNNITIYGEIKLRNEANISSQFEGRLVDFKKLLGEKIIKGEKIGKVVPAKREALLQLNKDINEQFKPILDSQIKSIPLYSPISGVVLKVNKHTGDLIQKGESIIHLGNLNILDVYAELPIKYLQQVKKIKNMTLKFLSYKHSDIILPIKAISGNVDKTKQTIIIRLELNNSSGEFYPGMLIQLIFPSAIHKNVLTLSRNSIIEEEGVNSVFILNDNKVEKRKVQVGIKSNSRIEIISGITSENKVVADKAYSLTDGMEVSE